MPLALMWRYLVSEAQIPLNSIRLAAIFETAKLWSAPHCQRSVLCKPGCLCVPRSCLSGPAMEMVEEIRRLRRIVQDTIEHSKLVDAPEGPKVIIDYEDFNQLAEAAKDNMRDDGL